MTLRAVSQFALLLLLPLVGCAPSDDGPQGEVGDSRTAVTVQAGSQGQDEKQELVVEEVVAESIVDDEGESLDADEILGPRTPRYVKCQRAEAETTLVLLVTIPTVMKDRRFTVPLRRRNIGKALYPAASRPTASPSVPWYSR